MLYYRHGFLLYMTRFDIITIFPELFKDFKEQSLLARGRAKGLIEIEAHQLRDFADPNDSHHTIDDRPFGGGVGMIMMVEPIMKAVEAVKKLAPENARRKIILFSPRGKKFKQEKAISYAENFDQIIMICGRYEGIDERVAKYIANEVVSIGDYVLFGGEVPAMTVIEAVARQIPGVIAKEDSATKPDHPQYTRPEVIEINGKKRKIPALLKSGNHARIEEWRKRHS